MTIALRVTIVLIVLVGGVIGGAIIEQGFAPGVLVLLLAAVVVIFGVLPVVLAERRSAADQPMSREWELFLYGIDRLQEQHRVSKNVTLTMKKARAVLRRVRAETLSPPPDEHEARRQRTKRIVASSIAAMRTDVA